MTVHAREKEIVDGSCVWDVVFETNTGREEDGGELPLLEAFLYDLKSSSYGMISASLVDVSSHRYARSGLVLVRSHVVFQVHPYYESG